MENFGSEIGQKMRSAVKAKLLELGTGGTAGYIDDELPDYVMIMVANKRSKEQMESDLNLFLGSQTELFVNWLHEVLQKLQEVTLPAAVSNSNAATKKRKSSQKDKKTHKKDKKVKAVTSVSSPDNNQEHVPSTKSLSDNAAPASAISSITEVFAEDVLEKAKTTLRATTDAETHIKKGKGKQHLGEPEPLHIESKNDFDIPTISEISSTTSVTRGEFDISGDRDKDLAELAAIQKRIYAAKKHLKQFGEIEVDEINDDFLNLSYDETEETVNSIDLSKNVRKSKSPITFNDNKQDEPSYEPNDISPLPTVPNNKDSSVETSSSRTKQMEPQPRSSRERIRNEPSINCKRPVHERLGAQQTAESLKQRNIRREKELYVPVYRRQEFTVENDRDRSKVKQRDISRERDSNGDGPRNYIGERESTHRFHSDRQSSFSTTSSKNAKSSPPQHKLRSTKSNDGDGDTHHRVESRVIIAPPKTFDPSDEEADNTVSVNSVIKIKPRPIISPKKQACSNLLLRAMADAQRSTVLQKSKKAKAHDSNDRKQSKDSFKLHAKKLYTSEYKGRLSRNAVTSTSTILRRSTQNLVIAVNSDMHSNQHQRKSFDARIHLNRNTQDKYPSSNPNETDANDHYDSQQSDIGCAEDANFDQKDYDNEAHTTEHFAEKTQFVVTLNDEKTLRSRSKTASPIPQVSSSSNLRYNCSEPSVSSKTRPYSRDSGKQENKLRRRKTSSKKLSTSEIHLSATRTVKRSISPSSSLSSNTPPLVRRSDLIEIYNQPRNVKKLIIKNDSDDENLSQKSPTKCKQRTRVNSSDISIEDRSTTPPMSPSKLKRSLIDKIPANQSPRRQPIKRKRIPIKFETTKAPVEIVEQKLIRESPTKKRRSTSREAEWKSQLVRSNGESHRKISIRTSEARKYDNIPSLSSVALNSPPLKVIKPKERCKYHPNCTKQFCDYYHPTAPCKSFPNCKFADKCMYSHPKCKYDLNCTNADCSFSHSGTRNPNIFQAPPLSSHVVPVQNYKSISAVPSAASTATCKYYPNCTKVGCVFYHPKPCRFGKNCINKLECNFYHYETQSKFKWIASVV